MNEQTNPSTEVTTGQESQQEINQNNNAEQNTSEENRNTFGQTNNEQVDFAQMYDMLTERDNTIKELKAEIKKLKMVDAYEMPADEYNIKGILYTESAAFVTVSVVDVVENL